MNVDNTYVEVSQNREITLFAQSSDIAVLRFSKQDGKNPFRPHPVRCQAPSDVSSLYHLCDACNSDDVYDWWKLLRLPAISSRNV